ncbi:MAG: 50S ribosomal protein L3 [Patescibacteria group bacterium]
MVQTLFATKLKMGQAWTKSGKRLAVTKLKVDNNVVLGEKQMERDGYQAFQIGYGIKKLKNMTKPLKTILDKSGFSFGVRQIREIKPTDAESTMKIGDTLQISDVLHIGDIVHVQGVSKGRGFAGVMKRHGFHGGPRTHGQSDRERAPGSIGNRTTPGRVFKGKRMAGHYGNVNMSVKNLQIVHLDTINNEVWVSGPVPSYNSATVRIKVAGNEEFEGLQNIAVQEPVVMEAEPQVIETVEATEVKVEEKETATV